MLRDIAGDAAQKAATKVNPSQDELSQIDKPAEDNTWHDVPDLSKDNLKQQFNQRSPFSKNSDEAKDQAKGEAQDTANQAVEAGRQPDGSVDPQSAASAGLSNVQSKVNANVSDEDKEAAKGKAAEYRDRTQDYLKQKLPEERREQAIWRLKKMVAEIQGHQDCESS